MNTGKIKFYNNTKAFGFIIDSDGDEIFFHVTGIANKSYIPQQGDTVSFETKEGKKGIMAVEVQRNHNK